MRSAGTTRRVMLIRNVGTTCRVMLIRSAHTLGRAQRLADEKEDPHPRGLDRLSSDNAEPAPLVETDGSRGLRLEDARNGGLVAPRAGGLDQGSADAALLRTRLDAECP